MSKSKPTWRKGGPYGKREISRNERIVLMAEYARGLGREEFHAAFHSGFTSGEINIVLADETFPPKDWQFELLTRYEKPKRRIGFFASPAEVVEARRNYMESYNDAHAVIADGCWVSPEGVSRGHPMYYDEYITSEAWEQKRQEKFQQSGKICERCGASTSIQVHHTTYRHLGNEPLEDLMVVCSDCHDLIHAAEHQAVRP